MPGATQLEGENKAREDVAELVEVIPQTGKAEHCHTYRCK
jgi:hypothetical protein